MVLGFFFFFLKMFKFKRCVLHIFFLYNFYLNFGLIQSQYRTESASISQNRSVQPKSVDFSWPIRSYSTQIGVNRHVFENEKKKLMCRQ